MDLNGFDMNLLTVFDALRAERSVSRAADRLGVTQSAVSAALSHLREYFEDELFVWNGRVMHATPKAEAMASRVKRILGKTSEMLDASFVDPANARREFTIASIDHIEGLFGVPLLNALDEQAPHVTINMVDATPDMYSSQSASNVDLFIMPKSHMPPGIGRSLSLLHDSYVAIAAAGNDRARADMSRAEFLDLPLIMFSAAPRENRSSYANWLLAQGINLNCRFKTAHFQLLAYHVAATDTVAVVPTRLASMSVKCAPIKMFVPPIPLPPIEISMYWQSLYDSDPVHQWLRNTIAGISRRITESSGSSSRNET